MLDAWEEEEAATQEREARERLRSGQGALEATKEDGELHLKGREQLKCCKKKWVHWLEEHGPHFVKEGLPPFDEVRGPEVMHLEHYAVYIYENRQYRSSYGRVGLGMSVFNHVSSHCDYNSAYSAS